MMIAKMVETLTKVTKVEAKKMRRKVATMEKGVAASARRKSKRIGQSNLVIASRALLVQHNYFQEAHKRPHEQNLFGIVQGGLDPVLRDICVRGLVDRNLPGYAIGGLAGGEDKDSFWRVVAQCTASLPEDKPGYVMGVGYPLDIVVCSALGADMYDSVYLLAFGTVLVPEGVLKLKHQAMADHTRPDIHQNAA